MTNYTKFILLVTDSCSLCGEQSAHVNRSFERWTFSQNQKNYIFICTS